MEVHLVHYNKKYGSYKRASNKKDGLAVVAFFVQAQGEKNYYDFGKITNYISNVNKALSRYSIESGNSNSKRFSSF